jgi:pyrimidine operon attenuation protein/uracil phosphoribosyltransferase
MNRRLILDSKKAHQKLQRMALQIYEHNMDASVVLYGIESGGYAVAQLLAGYLKDFARKDFPVHPLKINKANPLAEAGILGDSSLDLEGKTVIIIDDVQNSGRTMMYAIRRFLDYPLASVQACVLVDRAHPNFPVRCDYVGLSLSTTLQEHVQVEVSGDVIEVFLS